jgi:hypothetical protein
LNNLRVFTGDLLKKNEMNFTNAILDFLMNVMTFYRDFFRKTYGAAFVFSLSAIMIATYFLTIAPEAAARSFVKSGFIRSFFFHASSKGIYSLTDLSKPVFLVIAALFSIGYIKVFKSERFNFWTMISSLNWNDIFNVILSAILAGIIDVAIFYFKDLLQTTNHIEKWLSLVLYELRIYVPIILVSIAVSKSLFGKDIRINVKGIFFLLVCAWLFNEFMYEFSILFDGMVVSFFLSFVNFEDSRFIINLLISVPLFAFFMLGLTSVMTYPLGFYYLLQLRQDVEEE